MNESDIKHITLTLICQSFVIIKGRIQWWKYHENPAPDSERCRATSIEYDYTTRVKIRTLYERTNLMQSARKRAHL